MPQHLRALSCICPEGGGEEEEVRAELIRSSWVTIVSGCLSSQEIKNLKKNADEEQ